MKYDFSIDKSELQPRAYIYLTSNGRTVAWVDLIAVDVEVAGRAVEAMVEIMNGEAS